MNWYHWDAYHTQLPAEYEASGETVERDPSPEWHIPLGWVTAWIGVLSLISLGLGLALQWLLR